MVLGDITKQLFKTHSCTRGTLFALSVVAHPCKPRLAKLKQEDYF